MANQRPGLETFCLYKAAPLWIQALFPLKTEVVFPRLELRHLSLLTGAERRKPV